MRDQRLSLPTTIRTEAATAVARISASGVGADVVARIRAPARAMSIETDSRRRFGK